MYISLIFSNRKILTIPDFLTGSENVAWIHRHQFCTIKIRILMRVKLRLVLSIE